MADQPGCNGKTGGRMNAPPFGSKRSSGQIMTLFAISLLAMVPIVALIVDGGNIYVQRRTVQNAADAASMAGSRALIHAPASPDTTIADAVCKYLTANAFGTPPTATASFVDTTGVAIPGYPITTDAAHANLDCTLPRTTFPSPIPNLAAGVKVDAQIFFNTYLAGIAIGGKPGVPNVTTRAGAGVRTAGVVTADAHNAPFIICGVNTKLAAGGTQSLLQMLDSTHASTPYQIDPAAVGQTFVIHDSAGVAQCNLQNPPDNYLANAWKGLSDPSNGVSTLPKDLGVVASSAPGPTQTNVDGYAGCAIVNLSSSTPPPCVMIVPVARDQGVTNDLACPLWAAFEIISIDSDHHNAKLLPGYTVVSGPTPIAWTWSQRNQYPVTTLGLSQ